MGDQTTCGIHGLDTSPDADGNRRCVECDRDAHRRAAGTEDKFRDAVLRVINRKRRAFYADAVARRIIDSHQAAALYDLHQLHDQDSAAADRRAAQVVAAVLDPEAGDDE
jgi:hypothetical protein